MQKQYISLISLLVSLSVVTSSTAMQSITAHNASISNKQIWIINPDTVAQQKKAVAQLFTRSKYERIACITALTIGAAVTAYWLKNKLFYASLPNPEPGSSINAADVMEKLHVIQANQDLLAPKINAIFTATQTPAVRTLIEENARLTQAYQTALKAQHASELARAGNGLLGWGKNMVATLSNQFGFLLVLGALPASIQKMVTTVHQQVDAFTDRIFHDNSFNWFVRTQSDATPFFDELEECSEKFVLADSHDNNHEKTSIILAANMLSLELARLVGFMEYQSEAMRALYPIHNTHMRATAMHTYREIEIFEKELTNMLNTPTKHAEIPAYAKAFRNIIRSEHESFCRYEQAALHNFTGTMAT